MNTHPVWYRKYNMMCDSILHFWASIWNLSVLSDSATILFRLTSLCTEIGEISITVYWSLPVKIYWGIVTWERLSLFIALTSISIFRAAFLGVSICNDLRDFKEVLCFFHNRILVKKDNSKVLILLIGKQRWMKCCIKGKIWHLTSLSKSHTSFASSEKTPKNL